MAELDFEKASDQELLAYAVNVAPRCPPYAALRDRIVAQVEARVRAETVDREREAARKAWDAAAYFCGAPITSGPWRESYLAREYPAPAPSSVTLSDGSVVTYIRERDEMRRENVDQFNGSCRREFWPGLLNRPTDTGKDFEALQAFAATVEGR